MVTKKSRGKRPSGKRRKGKKNAKKDSSTWEEHNQRVKYAVAVSTERFLRDNEDNIGSSSAESVARNSYLAGMIDMLSIARNAFGFWGADQVLNELERVNRRFGQEVRKPDAEPEDLGPEECEACGGAKHPQTDLLCVEGTGARRRSGPGRDPMFA